MLTSIEIRNYQSLHSVELELSPLTVIVGPSSSGKSAFTRALRTLTSNQRGDAFITHGERTATITAQTDKGTVSLSRGAVNEYTLLPTDKPKEVFSKLNGTTPEEVTKFLGINPRDPLNYASQFDMPYLLTASAGEVARALGELTNVHVIFEAAREANRRRLTASQTLKTRTIDYAEIQNQIETYRPLKQQLAAIATAENHTRAARTLETRISKLDAQLTLIDTLKSVVTNSPAVHAIPDIHPLITLQQKVKTLAIVLTASAAATEALATAEDTLSHVIPSFSVITVAQGRLAAYQHIIQNMKAAAQELSNATTSNTAAIDSLAALEQQYTQTLIDAGTCPTCHQSTGGLHTH